MAAETQFDFGETGSMVAGAVLVSENMGGLNGAAPENVFIDLVILGPDCSRSCSSAATVPR
jgi:hypothetical protein